MSITAIECKLRLAKDCIIYCIPTPSKAPKAEKYFEQLELGFDCTFKDVLYSVITERTFK